MACRYHPDSTVAGRCRDCSHEFCEDCAVEIIRHGMVCADCGATFARRKLRQAAWAAAIGIVVGTGISIAAISAGEWLMAIWPPPVYGYLFPAVFFGFHYGGKIWARAAAIVDHFHGFAGFIAAICLLALRLTVAIYLGVFGGGIIQFLRYRKMVATHEKLVSPTS